MILQVRGSPGERLRAAREAGRVVDTREPITPGALSTPSERARVRRSRWRSTISPWVDRALRADLPPR
jgi:hypothetical protein